MMHGTDGAVLSTDGSGARCMVQMVVVHGTDGSDAWC